MKRHSILILLGTIIFSSNFCVDQNNERIKLYALCTPSHEVLRDKWFLPSIQDDYEIIIEDCQQECPTGRYMQAGWVSTMLRKMDLIIRAVKENWGSFFIVSDLDIQFFAPTKKIIIELMGTDKDMLAQKDSPRGTMCAGFIVVRANEKTLALWNEVQKRLLKNSKIHDQKALNDLIIAEKNPYHIKWDYLPDSFFGGGTRTGTGWKPGRLLPIPKDIVMHHANWTIGVSNKIAQLMYVKNEVKKYNKN